MEINEKEYNRLFNEKMDNPTSWTLRNNLYIDSFVNTIFEENKFLKAIVFDNEYDILKNDNSNRFIDDIISYFDHYYAVSFKENVSHIDAPEIISGIMNFPYINWNEIEKIILKIPRGWRVFIINPILMRYAKGSIGFFLTPKYHDNYYINECNEFIKSRTGYPLFLDYVNKNEVRKIQFNKPDLSLENYVKIMKEYGKNKGLDKLLDFWANNECVKVSSFESSFEDYQDNLPHLVWHDINFKEIKSNIPFELIHEESGEKLGPFKKFNLDKSFKMADVDTGILELSDSQIDDLIEGKYNFILLN